MQYKIKLIKEKKAENFKKGLLRKIPNMLMGLGLVAGLCVVENNTRITDGFKGTYKGYTMSEGVPYFIFDREIPKDRGNRPPKNPVGRYNLTKKLEIGKDYSVKTQRPGIPIRTINPLGPEKIVFIEPYNPNEQ